jgi:hypothetical protein
MDLVVQKAVELGVRRIQPVAAKRSVVRFPATARSVASSTGATSPSRPASNPGAIAFPP